MNQPNNDSPKKRSIDIYIETDNDIPPGHLRIKDIEVWPKMQQRALAKPIGEIEEMSRDDRLKNLTEDLYVSRYEKMLKLSDPPPVTVYKITDKDNKLVLVDGFNRLLASLNAGRETIPAIVIEDTEIEAIRGSCIANDYYRQQLEANDTTCAFLSYYYTFSEEERNGYNKDLTKTQMATALGVVRGTITNYLKKITEQTTRDNYQQKKHSEKAGKADVKYSVNLWEEYDAGIPVYRGSQIIEKENQLTNPIDQEYTLSECAEETEIKESELDPKKIYTRLKCKKETGFQRLDLNRWLRNINRKGQAIIQGPPGTGKTHLAKKLAEYLVCGDKDRWELVQFHPAYSYEDFIQGIRPQTKEDKLTYEMVQGRFLEFCEKAERCTDKKKDLCVLIIDEINRANLSQVFGELMYLLEYRDEKIPLAGSSEPFTFSIPENVRIIGTMNTADRSIALIDHALRRRFAFITIPPNYKVLESYHKEKNPGLSVKGLIDVLEKLNEKIKNPHYQIGMSFFLRENLIAEIKDIWLMEIEPYLEEYFFDQRDKVALEEFRWKKIGNNLKKSFAGEKSGIILT